MKTANDQTLDLYNSLSRHQFIIDDGLAVNPIRSEIFSAERLIQHAKSLALAQKVTNNPKKGYNLYQRLKDNKASLFKSYGVVNEAVNQKLAITSAAEWLIDNFYIIEGQLKDIQAHLPRWFYEELPKLAGGPLKGYPRVYGLSWAFVAHADSRFDPELLIQFVRAYQTVQPLTIGELWAIAITLRVVLIENLRCISINIVNSLQSRKAADQIADDLLGADSHSYQSAESFLYSFKSQSLRESFLVQLIQRLRYQDPSVTPALEWLNEKLTTMNLSADDIVSQEHNKQSAANFTVRNIITSMRLISAFDWRSFFESVSLVNENLNASPIFSILDFATQDQYLHALEELAKGSKHSEIDIAKKIILTINEYQNNNKTPEERKTDPGYYLISAGRKIIEKKIEFHPSFNRRLKDFYTTNAKLGYASSILIMTCLILAYPLIEGLKTGLSLLALVAFAIIAFPLASDIAIVLCNKSVAIVMGPQHLPRIKLKEGVPDDLGTFIVMPILLINKAVIEEHLQQLEVHYLSNPDGKVHFALLSDWKDSDNVNDPDDSELLNIAIEGITKLNSRYGAFANEQKRFFIFHRARIWNASEAKWMGWERKRGKLHELNCLLRGAMDTTVTTQV